MLPASKRKHMKINPQKLNGHWDEGWALDLHTLSSLPILDKNGDILEWETMRPPVAEELYRLKYCREIYRVDRIARSATRFLIKYISTWQIDLIIPVPPSDTTREFQPVFEMAKLIGSLTGLQVDFTTLRKVKSTSQLKEMEDPEARREILKDAFSTDFNSLRGKYVLIFDDLYRSGETLNAVCDAITNTGKASRVYALTITKTRSKR
jgi:competence protein ComFC